MEKGGGNPAQTAIQPYRQFIREKSGLGTDGLGNWITTWASASVAAAAGEVGTRTAISRSTDAGRTWSSARLLVSSGSPGSSVFEVPSSVQADGNGNWLLATDGAGGFGGVSVHRSQDHGESWSPRVPLDWGRQPRTATDGSGTWCIAYYNLSCFGGGCDPSLVRIARSTDGGDSWSTGTIFSGPALGGENQYLSGENVDLACDGQTWVAVWDLQHHRYGQPVPPLGVRCSVSTDGAATWSEPRVVTVAPGSRPRIVAEGAGRWLCVWQSPPWEGFYPAENDIVFSRSTDNGQTWGTPMRLNRSAAGYNISPAAVIDSQGRPVVAWSGKNSDEGGADYDIWFATANSTSFTGAADWQLFD